MKFNGEKFECRKIGNNDDLKLDFNHTTPQQSRSIDYVENLRDLGVTISVSGDFK